MGRNEPATRLKIFRYLTQIFPWLSLFFSFLFLFQSLSLFVTLALFLLLLILLFSVSFHFYLHLYFLYLPLLLTVLPFSVSFITFLLLLFLHSLSFSTNLTKKKEKNAHFPPFSMPTNSYSVQIKRTGDAAARFLQHNSLRKEIYSITQSSNSN